MDEMNSLLNGLGIDFLIDFLVSTGIGFLIGLERQFTKEVKEQEEQFGGIRTYTMVCILGFLSAFLSSKFGFWLFGVALVSMVAIVMVSYIQLARSTGSKGGTSEIATVITFLLGAIVFLHYIVFALIVMIVLLLLLAFKPKLHAFVNKLNREELHAIILFVIMSALILPFLPDDTFGPYGLWNLREIWKMVVLVSGTSLVGYLIAKVVGNKGTLLAGIVGGLVSSTAVTLAFSRKSKEAKGDASFYYAMGIISACTIMFPRILFEVYVVNPAMVKQLWIPVALVTIAGFGSGFLIYKFNKGKPEGEQLELKNPLDFSTAIKFALFYAGIQWLVQFSTENFGSSGTYLAGAISGITDVDAITLSMAKMGKGSDKSALAINTILIAALSNTLVKFIIVMVLGSKEIRKYAIIGFGSIFAVGLAYFCFRMFLQSA